ncbi:MAG: protein translocase subunit SecD [Gammaproteobacteria bacterium]|nr:protein translocase subunit SecD [Gammaproteobacteria bacterium]
MQVAQSVAANHYSFWKNLLIVSLVLILGLYALPNLYGEDPALQISVRSGEMSNTVATQAEDALKEGGIQEYRVEQKSGRLLIRFADTETQLKAKELVAAKLGNNYVIALNLAPATPDWLTSLGAAPMYLGLDLRGGVHFLMEVDMAAAIAKSQDGYRSELRSFMRTEKIRYQGITLRSGVIKMRFADLAKAEAAEARLKKEFRDLEYKITEDARSAFVLASLSEAAMEEERKSALQQNIITLRNRVNELGVAEPIIQQQGKERIVVQLPGVQDTARAKEILGATATLEFRLVHGSYTDWVGAEQSGRTPANSRLYHERDGSPVLLKRQVIVTGDQIKGAASGLDSQSGSPNVNINLDGKGASRMKKISRTNIGKPMAVVFIETRYDKKFVNGKWIKEKRHVEEVINIATIRDVLSHRFQISGLSTTEARDLSLLLRAGALKAPMEIIEERTVGPSLGQDNIDQGFNSVLIGLCLVLIFMAVYYRVFGLVANIALVVNLVLIVALLSILQATLTLPGIAGIVLTVGMAVDANVLIFERIREELRAGNSIQASISAGYDKAFVTIADANITTLLAAVVLFSFGTGAIKGFAVTLSIGIITSMFTAIMGSRMLINLIYGGKRIKRLAI